jgi:hypothetical protein
MWYVFNTSLTFDSFIGGKLLHRTFDAMVFDVANAFLQESFGFQAEVDSISCKPRILMHSPPN